MKSKRLKISRYDARKRTLKGWETRRRNNPKRVTKDRFRSKRYTWHRPSEKVKITGVTPSQLKKLEPALVATDTTLQPHIRLHTDITVARPRNRRATGEANVRLLRKSKIKISPKTFNKRHSHLPSGVLAHEIGHTVGPATLRNRAPVHRYQKDFQWKTPKKATRRSPIRKERKGQSKNMFEDFAETYRASTGLAMTKRPRGYYDVYSNKKRMKYMKRHYIK